MSSICGQVKTLVRLQIRASVFLTVFTLYALLVVGVFYCIYLCSLVFVCFDSLHLSQIPGCVTQSVTCLTTVCEFDQAWSYTLVEIDHEIISTVILLRSTDSFKKDYCQLQAKVCVQSTG